MDILQVVKEAGFQRKVYVDQNSKPVFFTKEFNLEQVPAFKAQYERDVWDCDTEKDRVVLEVSEDSKVFQFIAGMDYMDSINPMIESEKAKRWLKDFGLI